MAINKVTVSLFLITLLGLALRLYHLSTIPNGFFFDEATIAYQAYSLLKTGHDTWGNFLPILSFRDYGEYILPLGIYGQIPSIFLGGLTVQAARLPHAILGTLTIPLVYLLGKNLFSRKAGLISALFLAVSPLSLGWSRFVFEGNFGTVFFLTGAVFFSKFLKSYRYLPWAIFFWGISVLTYHVFLVVTPLFMLLLFFFRYQIIPKQNSLLFKNQQILLSSFLIIFFLLWLTAAIWSGAGRERFSQAATLVTEQELDILNHNISYCAKNYPTWVCKLTLNKPTLIATNYLRNYLTHFSPQFLAFDGTYLRRNLLPPSGILLFSEALFFPGGIFLLFKTPKGANLLALVALLIYPVANSFTGTGEISRIAFAAPFLSLIAAFGLTRISRLSFRWSLVSVPITVFSILVFLISYFTVFPIANAYNADFGYDRVLTFVRDHYANYRRFYLTSRYAGSVPAISALFFLPVNPQVFSKPGGVIRHLDSHGYYIYDRIDKLYFSDKINLQEVSREDFLVLTPEEAPKNLPAEFAIIDPTGRILLEGLPASRLKSEKS